MLSKEIRPLPQAVLTGTLCRSGPMQLQTHPVTVSNTKDAGLKFESKSEVGRMKDERRITQVE
jgi:hypothetical protein